METPVGPREPYTPITAYDKLDVVITQMLEGELSAKSAYALAFDPHKLTPEERTQLETHLLGGAPGNTMTKTAMGIVTNPMVWLYAMTGSAGANLAKHGVGLFGRSVVGASKKVLAADSVVKFAVERPGLLTQLDLLSTSQIFQDHPALLNGLNQMIDGIAGQRKKYLDTVNDSAQRVQKATGLWNGVNLSYPKNSDEYKLSKRINAGIHARMEGLQAADNVENRLSGSLTYRTRDRVYEEGMRGETISSWSEWRDIPHAEYVKRGRSLSAEKKAFDLAADDPTNTLVPAGTRYEPEQQVQDFIDKVDVNPTNKAPMVTEERLFAMFDEIDGLEDWFQNEQKAQRQTMIDLYGVEDGVVEMFENDRGNMIERLAFKVDPQKARKLFAGMNSKFWKGGTLVGSEMSADLEGVAMLQKMFGPEALKNFKKMPNGEEALLQMMVDTIEPVMKNKYYTPHRLMKNVDQGLPHNPNHIVNRGEALEQQELFGGLLTPTDGLITPRVNQASIYDPEDLDYMFEQFGNETTKDTYRSMRVTSNDALKTSNRAGKAHMVQEIDGSKVMARFQEEAGEIYATHIQEASEYTKRSLAAHSIQDGIPTHNEGLSTGKPNLGARTTVDSMGNDVVLDGEKLYTTTFGDKPTGISPLASQDRGFTVAESVAAATERIPDERLRKIVKTTVLPTVTRRGIDNQHLVTLGQFQEAKRFFGWMAETTPIKSLSRKPGDWGYRLRQKMQMLADPEFRGFGGAGMATGIAKYLYSSHLGLNLGSMTLNAMQPFLLTGTALGFRNVVPAYADAIKEVAKYGELRFAKHGNKLFLEPEQREALVREAFEFAEDIGITGDMMEQLDKFVLHRSPRGKSGLEKWTIDLPLKMFEKTEWLARSTTAHAVKRQYLSAQKKRAAKGLSNFASLKGADGAYTPEFRNVVKRANESFNFVPDELGTPHIFLPSGQSGMMGRLMANPLSRQFLSFGLKSFTGAFHTLPRMGGGTRTLFNGAGPEISNRMLVTANDIMRGLGMSAIVYEIGKGVIGADLSRSLFGSTLTDVGGANRLMQGDGGIPLPPAADIPVQFMRAFMADDMNLMARTTSRMLPGGVSLSRLLGGAPEAPNPAAVLQRTYADWENPLADGSIGVFDGRNGKLISYQKPQDLVLKSMGVDLGKSRIGGDVDGYMLKQRDQILLYRRRYAEMLLQGEMVKAKRIASEFEKRYHVPLTVTETQLNQLMRAKTIPRSERILDSIDKAVRPQMGGLLQGTQQFNVNEASLGTGETSRKRDPFREVPATIPQEKITQAVSELRTRDAERSAGFQGYSGF